MSSPHAPNARLRQRNRRASDRPDSSSRILVGLHIPKTGGTSFQRHVGQLGPEVAVHNSVVKNAARVLRGQPLLPEWPEERLSKVRSAFGHQMTLEDAFVLPVERLFVFTIIRDPFEFFLSSYKQYLRQTNERPMSPRAFFESQRTNVQARQIRRTFGRLSDRPVELSYECVSDVLSQLDAVLLTERLDDEIPALCHLIGLNQSAERSRVYPESIDLGGLTRTDIEERDHIDLALVGVARSRRADGIGNAFGSSGKDWPSVRQRLGPQLGDPVETAYFNAFRRLRDIHALRGLAITLEAGAGNDGVQSLLRSFLGRGYDAWLGQAPTIAEQIGTAHALRLNGRPEAAMALAEKLVEQNPGSSRARIELANCVTQKDPERARALLESVLAANPSHRKARELLASLTLAYQRSDGASPVQPLD